MGLDFSPITGGEGNIEFIAHLKWTGGKLELIIWNQMRLRNLSQKHIQN